MFKKSRLLKCSAALLVFASVIPGLVAQDNPFGGSGRSSARSPFKEPSNSKPTEVVTHTFDLGRVSPTRALETPALFASIWSVFRSQYSIGPDGEFVREDASTTPDNAETQAAFLRYVAANKPVVKIEAGKTCGSCTRGMKATIVDNKVVQVECPRCEGTGNLWVIDQYTLTYSGVVPPKPVVKAPAPAVMKPSGEALPATVPGSRADEYRMLAERIMVLGKRFKIDRDEFTKEAKYVPLTERSNLFLTPAFLITVTDEGRIMLFTRHRGNDWIFHDRFSVKVGDETFDSTKVSTARSSRKVMDNGIVLELCSYPEADLKALEAIAKSPESRVLLRLYGSEGIDTRELEKAEKHSLRDAVELSAVLKKVYAMRKEDGIKGKIGDDSK